MWPTRTWLMVRVGFWLCGLPLRLRVFPLPTLLRRLTVARRIRPRRMAVDDAVRAVVWLCRARLFRLPLFPRPCLRQALTLYYALTRLGYPAAIHFGVYKEGEALHAHSWVTLQGTPVAERMRTERLTLIYAYPAVAPHRVHGTDTG